MFPGTHLTKTDWGGEAPGETPSPSSHRSAQPVHGGPRWLFFCKAAGLPPSCPVLVGFPPLLASPPFSVFHHLGLGLQLPQTRNLSAWPCCVLKPSSQNIIFDPLFLGLEVRHVSLPPHQTCPLAGRVLIFSSFIPQGTAQILPPPQSLAPGSFSFFVLHP